MPLIRRLPKRGFNNAQFKKKILTVNLGELEAVDFTDTINEAVLREHGLIRGKCDGVKVLGDGELKKKISIEVDHISASAREKIEAVGGSITLRPPKPVQTKQPKKAAAKA